MKSLRTIITVLAVAIVIALIIVAPGIDKRAKQKQMAESIPNTFQTDLITLSDSEHIRGAENPEITIVEYSDLDCPFCHKAHPVIQQVVDENPDTVAWVYRHFPLKQLHPEAYNKSVITECIANQKGNDAFWKSVDMFMAGSSTDQVLDAFDIKAKTIDCLGDSKSVAAVTADIDSGNEIQVQGTPYFVIIGPNNQQYPIPGLPDKDMIDVVMQKLLSAK